MTVIITKTPHEEVHRIVSKMLIEGSKNIEVTTYREPCNIYREGYDDLTPCERDSVLKHVGYSGVDDKHAFFGTYFEGDREMIYTYSGFPCIKVGTDHKQDYWENYPSFFTSRNYYIVDVNTCPPAVIKLLEEGWIKIR